MFVLFQYATSGSMKEVRSSGALADLPLMHCDRNIVFSQEQPNLFAIMGWPLSIKSLVLHNVHCHNQDLVFLPMTDKSYKCESFLYSC